MSSLYQSFNLVIIQSSNLAIHISKYMQLLLSIFVSFIHFIFCFFIFMTALLSNNINVLTFLLVVMILTRLCYWMYGGCLLTTYEKNDYFSTTPQLFSKIITNVELKETEIELLLINVGMLIILNKIFWLILLSYYRLPFLQKIIKPCSQ